MHRAFATVLLAIMLVGTTNCTARDEDPLARYRSPQPVRRRPPSYASPPPPEASTAPVPAATLSAPGPGRVVSGRARGDRLEEALQNARENFLQRYAGPALEPLRSGWIYPAARRLLARECVFDVRITDRRRPRFAHEEYTVRITAELDEMRLRELCDALSRVLSAEVPPRLMVWFDEPGSEAGGHVAAELERALKEFNLDVRVRSRWEQLKAMGIARADGEANAAALRHAQADLGAPFYVVGSAQVHEIPGRPGDPNPARRLTDYKTSTQAVIHSSATGELLRGLPPVSEAWASEYSGDEGAVRALQHSGRALGLRCVEELVLAYAQLGQFGQTVFVTIQNTSPERTLSMREAIAAREHVLHVQEHESIGEVVTLAVRTRLTRQQLQDLLTRMRFGNYQLVMLDARGDRIETRLRRSD